MANPIQLFSLDDKPEYDVGIRGPAAYPRTDDAEEEKYAVYSREILDEQRVAMDPLYQTWTQNLLYLAGYQWWEYDPMVGTYAPPKPSKWRERPVRNLLKPFFKHFLAKAIKNRPVSSCVPASSDPEDIHAAELGNDVLRGKWIELGLSKILRRAIAWIIPTGNAAIMPYWNTDSGLLMPLTTLVNAQEMDHQTGMPTGRIEVMEMPADENGDPILDEMGNYDPNAEPHWIDIGEVGYKVLNPFQVFTDIGAESEDEMSFVLVAEPLTLREIRRRWPHVDDDGDSLLVAEDTSEFERFNQIITGMASGADTHMVGMEQARDVDIPKALVLHYFERPCPEYPEGRHWVTTGLKLLERPGPLPDGIWPVVIWLWDIDTPGRLHGEATMTAAVGLQREYNEICAAIKEHHNLLLRGKWLVPIGSNIRRGQITTQPGEVIQHTPGLPPVMADLKPLPHKVYEEREKVLADFELITSMHQISMGQPPPGVTSGRAFLTLQEADDTDLGPFIEMLENAVAKLGWLTIQLIQRYYEDERLLRVSGGSHSYRVRAFKGADLNAVVDVEPQTGSAFPWSAVAKQSMMIDLVQVVPELFQDPETGGFDHERFRRLLPVGGEEAVGIGPDLDVSEALREEEAFELWDGVDMAELPMVQPWQNHALHLRQHGRLLKSTAFMRWDEMSQQAMIQHWMETQATIIELQMQAAAMEAAAMGEAEEEEPGRTTPPKPEGEEAPE